MGGQKFCSLGEKSCHDQRACNSYCISILDFIYKNHSGFLTASLQYFRNSRFFHSSRDQRPLSTKLSSRVQLQSKICIRDCEKLSLVWLFCLTCVNTYGLFSLGLQLVLKSQDYDDNNAAIVSVLCGVCNFPRCPSVAIF